MLLLSCLLSEFHAVLITILTLNKVTYLCVSSESFKVSLCELSEMRTAKGTEHRMDADANVAAMFFERFQGELPENSNLRGRMSIHLPLDGYEKEEV